MYEKCKNRDILANRIECLQSAYSIYGKPHDIEYDLFAKILRKLNRNDDENFELVEVRDEILDPFDNIGIDSRLVCFKFRGEHYMVYTPEEELHLCFCKEFRSLYDYFLPDKQKIVRERIICLNGASLDRTKLNVSWDDVVLPDSTVKEDIRSFAAAKELYKKYKTPWKRGILLYGPPGNGKTTIVKAAISEEDLYTTVIYTRVENGWRPQDIDAIFNSIKNYPKPCLLVMEEISRALYDPTSAVYGRFLENLDGMEELDGVCLLCTDNHPERLDAALIRRPGRFDRVQLIGDPDAATIKAFSLRLASKYEIKLTEADRFAECSDGLSMASIEEVFKATMLHCAMNKIEPDESNLFLKLEDLWSWQKSLPQSS